MVSLKSVQTRFEVPFEVVEGGSGMFNGVISEAEQSAQPTYIFIQPRHVLRVKAPTALALGVVVRAPSGAEYLVGDNGPSEHPQGVLWESFRLFEVTKPVRWERRVKVTDVVTGLPRDSHLQLLGTPRMCLEPMDREAFDRRLRSSIEQSRFMTGAAVEADDVLDGRPVIRADVMLGVTIGIVS